jgi:hypothetical protein
MELDDILQESIKIHEEEFYSKKMYYSYSSLNKLMWNPQAYYQSYVLNIKEEKLDGHLVNGKLIHLLLLEPEKFDEVFIMSPISLPGDSIKKVVHRVYEHHVELYQNGDARENLEDFTDAIIDILKDINLYQSLKTDQQRIEKILTPEAFNYWNYLKMKKDKTIIDDETFKFCLSAVDIIKTHNNIIELLGLNVTDFDNKQVFNELPFQIDLPNKTYGFRGIIDNMVVDHTNRTIFINDIKTTSKELKNFSESVEFYSYWMQAIIYNIAVTLKYGSYLEQGYTLKFHFIVIDKMFQTYAFPVSETTLNYWLDRFEKVLQQAEWHYNNKDYSLPYEFATSSVIL